jgi:hypothetical protein
MIQDVGRDLPSQGRARFQEASDVRKVLLPLAGALRLIQHCPPLPARVPRCRGGTIRG